MRFFLNLVVSVCLLGSAAAFAKKPIEIMTYNQYLGADIEPLLGAADVKDFNSALLAVMRQVAANDFPARARAQADEIMRRQPKLIGLQEVWSFACMEAMPDGQVCQDPSIADAFKDHLPETMAALEEKGGDYKVAALVTNLDQTAPGIPFSLDESSPLPPQAFLQVIDRDVILAHADVETTPVDYSLYQAAGICIYPSSDGCNYQTVAVVPVPDPYPPLRVERGFVAVDALIDDITYRYVNTHLEVERLGEDPLTAFFQGAQAFELINTLMGTTPPEHELLVVGDINSSPDSLPVQGLPFPPPYQQFLAAGYTDIWNLRPGKVPGYTCCQAADLDNRKSRHFQRIDVLFALFPPDRAKKVRVLGSKVSSKLAPPGQGLWPSDHGAVAAGLQYR